MRDVKNLIFKINLEEVGKSDWFKLTWEDCYHECNSPEKNVASCAACWQESVQLAAELPNSDIFEIIFSDECGKYGRCGAAWWRHSKSDEITRCVGDALMPILNPILPKIGNTESSEIFKGKILLPKNRLRHWWALAVQLPCQPRAFAFENAYCINSARRRHTQTEYLLTQNKATTFDKNEIAFAAVFSDTCRFSMDEITILWDESFPAAVFPQFSSIPPMGELENFVENLKLGKNPTIEAELFYDFGNAQKLHKFGNIAPNVVSRRKRNSATASVVNSAEGENEWKISDYQEADLTKFRKINNKNISKN